MTGASFAQFFPSAPRAAKDRAMERERAKLKPADSSSRPASRPSSAHDLSAVFEGAATSSNAAACLSPAHPSPTPILNGAHQPSRPSAPNNGILNGRSPVQQNSTSFATNAGSLSQKQFASLPQMAQLTPPTSEESPAHSTSAARATDQSLDICALPPTQTPSGTLPTPSTIERAPFRDPSLQSKGSKCIYDPLLDGALTSSQKRKAKPVYSEISLDDDGAPPSDPRLARGGWLSYINVDFHWARSRLRHAPYTLRPYPYDPKTSVGPGPPTQIVVMGFDPLTTFSKIVSAFSTYGEIAESSNKMHPENGSYLGFATFRYKDSNPSRSRPVATHAIDAAREAVKKMNGKRIDSRVVRVDYDPDGRKSGRMLESLLQKDAEKRARQAANSVPPLSSLNARPESRSSNPPPGPPPTAPKAPAAQRGVSSSILPRQKIHHAAEESSLEAQFKDRPHIFISHTHVPYMGSIIPHMKRRLRGFSFDDICADRTGYYIVFPSSLLGRGEAERCAHACHRTEFFNYVLHMKLSLGPAPIQRKRTLSHSPDRLPYPTGESRKLDRERRRREDEADLEEEKRQRAKNFDPVKEAAERIAKEMRNQLIKRIRTHLSTPTLHKYLDPANPELAQIKRKHNIADFSGAPAIAIDSETETPPNATPNSRADPVERRTGRLDITALPRIRKAIKAETAARRSKAASLPRRRGGRAFRSLHYRLPDLDESEPESEDGSSQVVPSRDTEEPESAPRSRMSPGEDSFRDDWGQAEEDSMTEASFAVTEQVAPPSRKRKLHMHAEAVIKRLKKSDEELFGVTIDRIDTESPRREATEDIVIPDTTEATPEVTTDRGSETPAPDMPTKAKKKPAKPKRKTKKQLLEERQALKRQKEEQLERDKAEKESAALAAAAVCKEAPVEVCHEDLAEAQVQPESRKAVDPGIFSSKLKTGRFSTTVQAVAPLPADLKLAISNISTVEVLDGDLPNIMKLQRRFRASDIKDPALWLWSQNRIREMNAPQGAKSAPLKIEGYYVPNATGSARTDGVRKILNSEKSKYLPHHLRVQQARKEREASARVGKDTDIKKEIGKVPPKNNSRANRANNRRVAAELNDQKKAFGETSDVLRFNQLKKRKKPVKFDRSAIHNWGLFTLENIPKDDMIIEYVGEKVRQQISEIREQRYLKSGLGSSYLFRIDDNWVIDATKKGGIARFINHSCQPNCKANIIRVEGTKRIVIYALRDIAMNEELTYDYKFEREIGAVDRIPCLCGTPVCKGFLN